MMPETCWDKSLIINIRLIASCWFLSLHPTTTVFRWDSKQPAHMCSVCVTWIVTSVHICAACVSLELSLQCTYVQRVCHLNCHFSANMFSVCVTWIVISVHMCSACVSLELSLQCTYVQPVCHLNCHFSAHMFNVCVTWIVTSVHICSTCVLLELSLQCTYVQRVSLELSLQCTYVQRVCHLNCHFSAIPVGHRKTVAVADGCRTRPSPLYRKPRNTWDMIWV